MQNASKTLDEEFTLCVIKNAEKKNDMNSVIKGNALKRRSEEAQAKLKNLQQALGILKENRKKRNKGDC